MDTAGTPWFVAADVCAVLGLAPFKRSFNHHLRRLGADGTCPMSELGQAVRGTGMANARLISESGLYKLILRCHDQPGREGP